MSVHYYEYLKGISWRGTFYRRYFLYPKLLKYCHGKVLDVGCGTGEFLSLLESGVGVDINGICVKHCLDRGLEAVKMEEDILPFDNESFDTLILDNVLEHISEPNQLIKELIRVLKIGGIIIIGVPLQKGYKRDPDHKIFYNKESLLRLNQEAGLQVKNVLEMPVKGLGQILSAACTYSISVKLSK